MKNNTINFSKREVVSRRDFLKKASMGTLVFAVAGELPANAISPLNPHQDLEARSF